MKQLWLSSMPDRSHAPLLPIWWTFWLLSIFVGRINFKASMKAETVEELIYASQIHLANCAVDLPLTALALAMVIILAGVRRRRGSSCWCRHSFPLLVRGIRRRGDGEFGIVDYAIWPKSVESEGTAISEVLTSEATSCGSVSAPA